MKNDERKKALAKEAVKLIKEFKRVESVVTENTFKSVRVDRTGTTLVVLDEQLGSLRYGIGNVSSVVGFRINGFGPCGSDFHYAIEKRKNDVKQQYGELTKKEFVSNMGHLCYIECRCEEIYSRLRDIEKEAARLQ